MLKPVIKNIPDELKAIPNWVNWKKDKIPVNPSKVSSNASSTNKDTWSEFDKAKDNLAKKQILGIGFVLTNTDDLIVIDIDNCVDKKTGRLDDVADFWVTQFDSYTEVSPSGTGIHIFVRGPNIGTGKNLPKKYSSKEMGFEIYCTGRYFTVTGVPLKEYDECGDLIYNACAVNMFYNTYFKKGRKENTWRPCDGPLEEGSRNTTLQAAIGSLTRMVTDNASDDYTIEMQEDFIETIIYHYNEDYISPPLSDKEITNQILSSHKYLNENKLAEDDSAEEADEEIAYSGNDEFNPRDVIKDYAFITNQNKFLHKQHDILLPREALDISTGHMKFYKKTKEGRRQVSFPEYFKLSQSKTVVSNITWSPKREEIYKERSGSLIYNTYKPISHDHLKKSVSKSDISLYIDLLKYVIPNEAQRETFIDFLAFTMQYPEKKINYSIILGSEYEGVGKDLLLRPVVNFMDNHCKEITVEMLHSDFNHYLYGVKLLIVQEIFTSSYRDKKEIETKLKTLAAAPPDKLSVNKKNMQPLEIDNIVNLVATTNHDDALPITNADSSRRYYAIWSEVKPKSSEYYTKLVKWMYEDGGMDLVAGYLINKNVSKFKYARSPAKTLFLEKLADSSKDNLYHRIKLLREEDVVPFNKDLVKIQDVISALDDPKLNPQHVARSLSQLGMINLGTTKGGNKKKVIKKAGKTSAVNIFVNKNYDKYKDMPGSKIVSAYENNHPSYSKGKSARK